MLRSFGCFIQALWNWKKTPFGSYEILSQLGMLGGPVSLNLHIYSIWCIRHSPWNCIASCLLCIQTLMLGINTWAYDFFLPVCFTCRSNDELVTQNGDQHDSSYRINNIRLFDETVTSKWQLRWSGSGQGRVICKHVKSVTAREALSWISGLRWVCYDGAWYLEWVSLLAEPCLH